GIEFARNELMEDRSEIDFLAAYLLDEEFIGRIDPRIEDRGDVDRLESIPASRFFEQGGERGIEDDLTGVVFVIRLAVGEFFHGRKRELRDIGHGEFSGVGEGAVTDVMQERRESNQRTKTLAGLGVILVEDRLEGAGRGLHRAQTVDVSV